MRSSLPLSIATLPLILALLLGCKANPEAELAAAPLPAVVRVASDLDNPPFAYLDPAGVPAGHDVQLMGYLARELGVQLEWVRMPFEALLDAVERGDVELVCATLGVSPERAKRVAFSRPYYFTRLSVVVRDGLGEPRELRGLEGKRVAASTGTTAQAAVLARLPDSIGVFAAKGARPAGERLALGEIDAVVMDGPAARKLVASAGGSLRLLEEDLGRENYALAMPRARARWVEQVDQVLIRFERDGTLLSLDAEWNIADE